MVQTQNVTKVLTRKIPVANITALDDQKHNRDIPTKWTELTAADNWCTALVLSSSPPVVVGGEDDSGKGAAPTSNMKMYNNSIQQVVEEDWVIIIC